MHVDVIFQTKWRMESNLYNIMHSSLKMGFVVWLSNSGLGGHEFESRCRPGIFNLDLTELSCVCWEPKTQRWNLPTETSCNHMFIQEIWQEYTEACYDTWRHAIQEQLNKQNVTKKKTFKKKAYIGWTSIGLRIYTGVTIFHISRLTSLHSSDRKYLY